MQLPSARFSSSSKNKKIHPEKMSNPLKLYDSNIKKFSYILVNGNYKKNSFFSQNNTFLVFQETETLKNYLYSRKQNFFIFQVMETLKLDSHLPKSIVLFA